MIGISGEPLSTLRERFVEQQKATFWLCSERDGEWVFEFIEPGLAAGIPHFVLVDADGYVVGHDVPTRARLEELLAQVFEPALGRELHDALADARTAYDGGAIGAARAAAAALLDHADEAVAADARWLCDKVTGYEAWARRRLGRELASGKANDRYAGALVQRRVFDGLDLAVWLDERLAALQVEVAAGDSSWRDLERALDREFGAFRKPVKARAYELKRAAQEYEKVVKRHARTAAARVAQERAAALAGG